MTIRTVTTSFRVGRCTPSSVCRITYVTFVVGGLDSLDDSLAQCGPMPFARVAQHRVLQPVSSSGDEPQVHGLTLDTDFAATTESQYVLPHRKLSNLYRPVFLCDRNGNVHFALQGMNTNGNPSTAVPVPRGHRRARGRHSSRGEFSPRNFITDGLNGL